MTDFCICFCDGGDSREKSRGWDVKMGRWGGRSSDMVALLRVAEEHRREEADIMIASPRLCLLLSVLDHRTFRNMNFIIASKSMY